MTEPDFRLPLDDGPGPAAPIDDFDLERRIQASVDAWSHRRPVSAWPRRLAIAAALALALPTGAWAAKSVLRILQRALDEGETSALAPRAPEDAGTGPEEVPTASAPLASPEPAPLPSTLAPVEPRVPIEPRAPKPEKRTRKTRERRGPSATPPPSRPAPPPAVPTLAEASRARRAHRWQEAARLYALILRHGAPADAHVAGVAEGQLRLEKLQDPKSALRAFRGALEALPRGALEAEALHGAGASSIALGRHEEAERTWRRLIERYPNSVPARKAREALEVP